MYKKSKIFVAGGSGLVGSAIIRKLVSLGYHNIISNYYRNEIENTENVRYLKLNLLSYEQVKDFFQNERPEYVFVAAARVGGIAANNNYRAVFIYENLQIQNNLIHLSYLYSVSKLIFLGSSCIYPKKCPQPMDENMLLSSELEYTNEPYAIAKIAGMKMCEAYNIQYKTNFLSLMPTNLYGPNDNYNLQNSHVLAAFIRKFYLAKCFYEKDYNAIAKDFQKNPPEQWNGSKKPKDIDKILEHNGIVWRQQKQNIPKIDLKLWGTGEPRREFLHVDDLADACVYTMEQISFKLLTESNYSSSQKQRDFVETRNTHFNVGTGEDIPIKELALLIAHKIGYKGNIAWDTTKPNGTFQKLLNVEKFKHYGWSAKIKLDEGLDDVIKNYIES